MNTETFTLPFVIPEEMHINIKKALTLDVPPLSRVLIYPANAFYTQMLYGGYLSSWQILGALPLDEQRQHIFVKSTTSLSEAYSMNVDALLCVDPCFTSGVPPAAKEISERLGCACINLCDGYDRDKHRRSLERQLDPMRYFDGSMPKCIEVHMPPAWGLGDFLCGLTAARAFARRNPEIKIYFNRIPKVVEAFGDNLVRPGQAISIHIARPDAIFPFWEQKKNLAANYTDCYFLSLGLKSESPPFPELPQLPPFEQLQGTKYAVLQPRAGAFARPHLKWSVIQRLIDASPLPVFLAGRKGSEQGLLGINTTFSGDEFDMLRLIQHATLVLTPRSATAHIAAGYGIPAIVWLPDDHWNWHLDYPNWPVRTVPSAASDVEAQLLTAFSEVLGPECPLSSRGFSSTRTLFTCTARGLYKLKREFFRCCRQAGRFLRKFTRRKYEA